MMKFKAGFQRAAAKDNPRKHLPRPHKDTDNAAVYFTSHYKRL